MKGQFTEGGPIEPGEPMRAEDFDRLLSGLGCGCCPVPREHRPRGEITGTISATFEFTPDGVEFLKSLPVGLGPWGVCAVEDSRGIHCPNTATTERRGLFLCEACARNVDAGAYGPEKK